MREKINQKGARANGAGVLGILKRRYGQSKQILLTAERIQV
jgi:hypothetical protein